MGLSPLSILVQLYHGTTFMVISHQQVSLIDETEITGEKHQYVFTPAFDGVCVAPLFRFCFLFLFVIILCLVCLILLVSLDCPFLIASSVFSNVYSSKQRIQNTTKQIQKESE
jgi:hypothetical protein